MKFGFFRVTKSKAFSVYIVMDNNNKEDNYPPASFSGVDFSSLNHDHQNLMMKPQIVGGDNGNNTQMVDSSSQHMPLGFCSSTSFDKLSFADVMQFADFGPKLALNQISETSEEEEEAGRMNMDPNVYFLKFPVLNERLQEDQSNLMAPPQVMNDDENNNGRLILEKEEEGEEDRARVSENTSVQLQFLGEDALQKSPVTEGKNKRKRPRTMKTTEEVESQRMTHIAVERNRRKQMNEHLRVLRGLMPGSYVQRGDQASIIGGAIEFVRELEQLLQCLESQKRRRLYGDNPPRPNMGPDSSTSVPLQQPPQPGPFFPLPDDQIKLAEIFDAGLREETAESKSCLADVEVRLLGFDAMIKILCRRKPGQLIKIIAALEDLQLNILHTNITTIEQTVLYSFNVKVASEARFTAEDMANSVQQIFSFIHANNITI